MSINVVKVGHAVLRVHDLDRSVAFYETLGLREVARRDFDGEHWVFLSSGNNHHDLALVEGGHGLHHVALAIGDETEALREAKRTLETADITVNGAMNFEVSQALFVSDEKAWKEYVRLAKIEPQ